MRKKLLILFTLLLLFQEQTFSQISDLYLKNVKEADSLYKIKEFKKASDKFTAAFQANNWKGYTDDRYKASKAWALAGVADSAFAQLYRIVEFGKTRDQGKYMQESYIKNDSTFNTLHKSPEWGKLFVLMNKNLSQFESKYDRKLIASLDTIFQNDQRYRLKSDSVEKKFGHNSKENIQLISETNFNDSLNTIKVKNIIDKYGWLGEDVIGANGNRTLFLVIQHADIVTQEKYLPILRDAVKNSRARGSQLALLEDRINIKHGRKQIYGSQIMQDPLTRKYLVLPIEDPQNVDLRRKEVGLGPLKDYVKQWDIEL